MAYRLLPGIRQDHRGRFYQNAVYPSGKTIMVPYQGGDAPKGRTIPSPLPPERKRPTLRAPTYDLSKRRMEVHYRIKGEEEVRVLVDYAPVAQAFVDQHRAQCLEDTKGEPLRDQFTNSLLLFQPSHWDFFIQQHIDLQEGAT